MGTSVVKCAHYGDLLKLVYTYSEDGCSVAKHVLASFFEQQIKNELVC